MNHAKIFCNSCLTFFVKFHCLKFEKVSRIVFKNAENVAISFFTFVGSDVWTGDGLSVSVFSSIDK